MDHNTVDFMQNEVKIRLPNMSNPPLILLAANANIPSCYILGHVLNTNPSYNRMSKTARPQSCLAFGVKVLPHSRRQ